MTRFNPAILCERKGRNLARNGYNEVTKNAEPLYGCPWMTKSNFGTPHCTSCSIYRANILGRLLKSGLKMKNKPTAKARHVVAWMNKAEWDQVLDYLYSKDAALQNHALQRISAWKGRWVPLVALALHTVMQKLPLLDAPWHKQNNGWTITSFSCNS